MTEREPRERVVILSEEKWSEIVEESKGQWIELSKQLVEELNKVSGNVFGAVKLMSGEMSEEIANKVGIRSEEMKKYAVFHHIVGSTPDFKYTPYIDLPGNLIENAYREKLEELKKINK